MKRPSRKEHLISVAISYRGKPFFSKPVDARFCDGWVEIKHQASHELEPHWDQICHVDQIKLESEHYAGRGDQESAISLLTLLEILTPGVSMSQVPS